MGTVVVAAVLVLVIIGSGIALVGISYGTRQSTATGVRPSTPEPAPDPPPTVNPRPEQPYDGRCPADALRLTYAQDTALGTRYGNVTALNVSSTTCTLRGRPDFAFIDADGKAVYPMLTPGDVLTKGGGTPSTVDLAPGRSAQAELRWRADGPAGSRTVDTIWLAPGPARPASN